MLPNVVLFEGADSSGHAELWETNGTAAGTFELTGIPGAATTGVGFYPSNLTNYNGEILFGGFDASGRNWIMGDGRNGRRHARTGRGRGISDNTISIPRRIKPVRPYGL